MHLLYIDGSGSVGNPNERYFVLAGVSVFERQLYHAIAAIDDLVESFQIGPGEDVELHGSHMYSGRSIPWRSIERSAREDLLLRSVKLVARHKRWKPRAFAIVVEKPAISPRDAVEYAFEEICNRFNLFLVRNFNRTNDQQKGLVIMDESNYERTLQSLAKNFRISGTRWGHLRNMAEVPLFVDSKASRLVQIADIVAYATWRKYEHGDGRFFDPLVPAFDNEGGVIHGLVHYRDTRDVCYCPGCMSRR